MRTLLSERFAPTTTAIGFLELPLGEAAAGLERWRRTLYKRVAVERSPDAFPEVLRRLEPLTGGSAPRELLVAAGDWTAYFDGSLRGTDAAPPISYLARELGCRGVAIMSQPHTEGVPGIRNGRYGAVQFQLVGPVQTDWLNYVRTISVTHDGSRWSFDASGSPQDFEDLEAYRSRRIRDRFTSEMLERYCKALGIEVFDPEFYGPESEFLESNVVMAADGLVLSLDEAQAWLEIVPGMAENLPG